MGQSFLTHDEKSSQGSPSPDLLQFNGGSHPKCFGSLSSVKETSTPSSSRSLSSSSSPRSPISPPARSEDDAASSRDDVGDGASAGNSANSLYENPLVPTPIQPGNVSRLREKFMDLGKIRRDSDPLQGQKDVTFHSENSPKREVQSEVDCRFISRPTTSSPTNHTMSRRIRGATLPSSTTSTPRSRNSLHSLNPSSYYQQQRHHRHFAFLGRTSRTLPSTPGSFSAAGREAEDLSRCFREMTLASSCTVNNFSSETPLIRPRPRTRPYVPPPRSVIIRSGYLPTVQTVDMKPPKGRWTSATQSSGNKEGTQNAAASSTPSRSQSDCFTSSIPPKSPVKTEELQQASSSTLAAKHPFEEHIQHVVTNKGDHTEHVLKKDAEVNTSAEVLVLPKGTKTSVLLKSAVFDEVDGKGKRSKLRRRKKKRGIRRVARVFSRLMIGLVELF